LCSRTPLSFPTRRSSDLVDRDVIHRVIEAHTRSLDSTRSVSAGDVLSQALDLAALVSILRMLSIRNGWELSMRDFPFGLLESREDRKSTRLNSSHVKISY